MIKFFRKIRQQLLSENKFSKYLIYALGEIILVVIGILIALSINNGNEERKLDVVELNILKGIKQNILMDTINLNRNIKRYKEMWERDSIISFHLVDKKPLDSLIEEKLLDLSLSNISINLHTSYFDEAKTKGLSIISNKSLRDSISRLYEDKYANVLLTENGLKQYDYLSVYENLMSDYAYLDPVLRRFIIGENHYQSMLNDKFFTKKLLLASRKMVDVSSFYDDAYKSALDVVSQIDNELAIRE
jgi:hypothetical protein